jgi:hypothetical protein
MSRKKVTTLLSEGIKREAKKESPIKKAVKKEAKKKGFIK